jgi:hypothetical protein
MRPLLYIVSCVLLLMLFVATALATGLPGHWTALGAAALILVDFCAGCAGSLGQSLNPRGASRLFAASETRRCEEFATTIHSCRAA